MVFPMRAVATEMVTAPSALCAAFAIDLEIFADAGGRLDNPCALAIFHFRRPTAETRTPDGLSLQSRGIDIDAFAIGIEHHTVDVPGGPDSHQTTPDVFKHHGW